MLLAVAVTVATPEALVTAVAFDKVALAPEEGAVKVTVAPLTRFPLVSFTVAWSGVVKAPPKRAACGAPAVAVMLVGAPAAIRQLERCRKSSRDSRRHVSARDRIGGSGDAGDSLSVSDRGGARHRDAGAGERSAKGHSHARDTGLPRVSFTVAWSGCAKAVPTVAVCGVPPVAVMKANAVLVNAKVAVLP